MTKKLFLLGFCLLTFFVSTQAQPWLDLLPKEKTNQTITLQDHKQAFDTYWKPYNVENGYYYKNDKKHKAYGWKQFMRWHYQMEGQVDKNGIFPKKSAQQVYDEFVKTNPNSRSDKVRANWTSLGTNSSTGGYAGIGRINCVAFHPTDNNTYWVGTPAGGLWVTRNNGTSWTCLTDDNQILGVSDIIIPSDYATSKTIYIGTGDRDGWDNRGIGVLKSTDDGATWNTTGLSFSLEDENRINRMLLDPTNDQTIIAATNDGVYKTTDGGTNWNKLSNKIFIDLEYKPEKFSRLYGSTENGEIFVSTNGGTHWSSVFTGGSRIELAVSEANKNLVVAVVSDYQGGLIGVYKSINSGISYIQVLNGNTKNLLGYETDGSDEGGQGWYDLAIAVSPTDADIIFVGGVNTWKSTDGGTTWSISSHWSGDNGVQEVHADKHALNYRSNGDLFEGNDGGIYISKNNGTSWTDKSNGLVISQMYKLSVSAQESSKTITGLQDNGSKLLENNTWSDVTGGDGMECLIDYTNSNIQYATYARGELYRTTDNWNNYSTITPKENGIAIKGAWVTPYVISPTDHNTLYAGYEKVWKTTDKGNTWTKSSTFTSYYKIRSMAIAPSNSSVLYVADRYSMWKTNDGGTSWTSVTLPSLSGSITYIAVKNDEPEHLWLTTSGYNNQGVYESTDGGSTWTNISTGLPEIPVYTIVQNKQATTEVHLYAGTELGVYVKIGDNNWVEYNDELPKVKCGELEIYYDETSPSNSRLRLASYGRGLWETPLAEDENLIHLTTTAISSLTTNSAVTGGNITSDGGSEITTRGIVWGTTTQPTLSDNVITVNGTSLGEFTVNITGLTAATTYYVRAYATNANGTTYGNEISFMTSCNVITSYPYIQGFEGSTFPPKCWTSYRGDNNLGTQNNWIKSEIANTGNSAAYVKYEEVVGGDAEDWLVTPAFVLPSEASLSFYQKQSFSDEYYSVYEIKISTSSQTDISSFTNVESYGEGTFSETYSKKEVDLSAYAGQTVYIAFVMTNNDGDSWFIDDVKIDGTFSEPTVSNFSATATQVCAGSAINFTDLSANMPTSWAWNFGDGTPTVTEQNPTHIYTTPGTYTVSLSTSNSIGGDTKTMNNYITVVATPNAGTNGTLGICENTTPTETELFNALGGTPDQNGTWTNNGLVYTYTVAENAPCGNATATVTITEKPAPNAGTDGTLEVCEGITPSETDLFNALDGTPDQNGTWTNNGLIYTYTTNNDCGSATATVTVTEKPLAIANFTTDTSNSPTIIFTNTSTNSDTYNWNLGDGTTETTTDVEHTYTNNGTYTISLDAENNCGTSKHEETLYIGTIDIEDLDNEKVKIYPNPTNNYVNIELGENYSQVKSVLIIDNAGELVYYTETINQPTLSLSTKDFAPGIYLINILKNKTVIKLELIVTK